MARALVFFLALGLAPLAAAQPMDPAASPVGATLAPGTGVAQAAVSVRVGSQSPTEDCYGTFGGPGPDAVVDWAGGDLRIWMRAAFDATMAVYGPDGTWVCDDDTERLLPVVSLAGAPAGRYAVWIGSFVEPPETLDQPRATLYAGAPPPPPTLAASARPAAGTIRAAGGFAAAQGAIDVAVRAGGWDDMSAVDLSGTPGPPDFCTGYVDAGQPTAEIDYRADGGTGALGILASAEEDLVLVVRVPSGQILCNDDASGSDPALGVETPESGLYTVWVGTFAGVGEPVRATLSVSEEMPDTGYDFGDDFGDDGVDGPVAYAQGVYVPLDLAAVPGVRIQASASERGSARVTIRPEAPNPVQGPTCRGYVEPAATAAIELRGDGPFAITATGDDDLTLTVRAPGGTWLCSDDADGLNPGIQIDVAEAGRYLVWLGAFREPGGQVAATLAATAGEIVVNPPYDDGYGAAGVRQSQGAYSGTEIRAGGAAVVLEWTAAASETGAVQAGGAVPNPVEGEACGGFVSQRPSAEVRASGGFMVSATGAEDLTLTVLAPDGTWTCSDDADGTHPRAVVDGGQGVYSVWVGTYYRRTEPAPATLRVEGVRRPAPPPPPTIRG